MNLIFKVKALDGKTSISERPESINVSAMKNWI